MIAPRNTNVATRLFVSMILSAFLTGCGSHDLIPYTIIKSSEFLSYKSSFDVRVDLVDGRLPTEAELVAISHHLKDSVGPHDRTFVAFYLPDMIVDSGAYATAHHNPNCEFRLFRFFVPEQYIDLLPPDL